MLFSVWSTETKLNFFWGRFRRWIQNVQLNHISAMKHGLEKFFWGRGLTGVRSGVGPAYHGLICWYLLLPCQHLYFLWAQRNPRSQRALKSQYVTMQIPFKTTTERVRGAGIFAPSPFSAISLEVTNESSPNFQYLLSHQYDASWLE